MRSFFICWGLLAAASVARAQRPAPAILQGVLTHLPAPTTVYLVRQLDASRAGYLDSAVVGPTGAFRLRAVLAHPDIYLLQLGRPAYGQRPLTLPVPLAGGEVVRLVADAPRLPVTARLSGTPEAATVQQWLALEQANTQRTQALIARYAASGNGTQPGAPAPAEWDAAHAAVTTSGTRFVRQHLASPLAPYVTAELAGDPASAGFVDSVTSCFARTLPQAAATGYLLQRQRAQRATRVGELAPELQLPALTGPAQALSALRGHYVLLDFWASWCAPCRAEHPALVALYARYHARGLAVYGVSLDESASAWRAAVVADQLPGVQVADLQGFRGPAAGAYATASIPATYLLDPQGRIVAKDLRGEELARKLAALLP